MDDEQVNAVLCLITLLGYPRTKSVNYPDRWQSDYDRFADCVRLCVYGEPSRVVIDPDPDFPDGDDSEPSDPGSAVATPKDYEQWRSVSPGTSTKSSRIDSEPRSSVETSNHTTTPPESPTGHPSHSEEIPFSGDYRWISPRNSVRGSEL